MFFFVICLPFPRPYSSFWFCLPVARNYTLHSLSSVVFLLLSNIRALAYFNLVPPYLYVLSHWPGYVPD